MIRLEMLLSDILNVSMDVVMSQKITRDIYAAKLKNLVIRIYRGSL